MYQVQLEGGSVDFQGYLCMRIMCEYARTLTHNHVKCPHMDVHMHSKKQTLSRPLHHEYTVEYFHSVIDGLSWLI